MIEFTLVLCGVFGFALNQFTIAMGCVNSGTTNKLLAWRSFSVWVLAFITAFSVGIVVALISSDEVVAQTIREFQNMELLRAILLGYAALPALKKASSAVVDSTSFQNTPLGESATASAKHYIRTWWSLQ